MKTMTVRETFSLDSSTALEIEDLARQWGVPKSEVVRRSVRSAAERAGELAPRRLDSREALRLLQQPPRLSAAETTRWQTAIREERVAADRRRLRK